MDFKKICAIALSLLLTLGFCVPVFAEKTIDPDVTVYYNMPTSIKIGEWIPNILEENRSVSLKNLVPNASIFLKFGDWGADTGRFDLHGCWDEPEKVDENGELITSNILHNTLSFYKPGTLRFQAQYCYEEDYNVHFFHNGTFVDNSDYIQVGDPFTVIVEEPVIQTNAPLYVQSGDTLVFTTELTNTALVNTDTAYYLGGGGAHDVAYQPSVEIIEGKEIVSQSNQDYSNTLKSSETLTFSGVGTVKLKVTYKQFKTCEFCIRNDSELYNPEKVITIQVKDTPIQSIEVPNVTLFEYSNGYYASDDRFIYSNYSPKFTVTMKDGSIYKGIYGIEFNGKYHSLDCHEHESQWDAEWKAGQSYSVTAELGGITDDFTVTIVESPISDFEIEEIMIPEKELGLYDNSRYLTDKLPIKFTAKLKDGSVINGADHNLCINGENYFLNITDNQSNEPWELGGIYTASVRLFGVDYPFNIKIVENPKKVVDFQAEDSTVMYGLDDWWGYNGFVNSADDLIFARDFSLTLADGSILKSKNGSILFEDISYMLTPEYSWNKSEENLWELGNSFSVTATFQDFSDTFEMIVVDSCIESIDFSDVTVIENANIHEEYYHNLETGEFEKYNRYEYYPSYTVTFIDGRKETFDYPNGLSIKELAASYLGGLGGDFYYGCFPICIDSQAENQWEVGNTYTVSVSLLGFRDTINVTVIENPVMSIVPDKMMLISNNYWWYRADNLENMEYYSSAGPQYTVTLKDGTVLKTESKPEVTYIYIYDEIYDIDCMFFDKYWDVRDILLDSGFYNLPATIYAFGEEYKLNIPVDVMTRKEYMSFSGVAGIEIKDVKFFGGTHYGTYYTVNPEFELIMNDGSKINSQTLGLLGDTIFVHKRNWEIGKTYTLTGSFWDLTDEFNVTVIENPIEKVINSDIICKDPEYNTGDILFNEETKKYVVGKYINTTPILLQLKDGTIVDSSYYSYSSHKISIYNNTYFINIEPKKEDFYLKDKKYDATAAIDDISFDVHITFIGPEHRHVYTNDCDTTCNICGFVRLVGDHVYDNDCDPTCNICDAVRIVPDHIYTNDCDATCNVCGFIRVVGDHVYDNDCDPTCNICGTQRSVNHLFGDYIYNNDATYEKDGTKTRICIICNHKETIIAEGTKLKKEITDSSKLFTDVNTKAWYKPYIDYVVTYGLLNGTGNGKMEPDRTITRAEFVQILANLSGIDTSNKNVNTSFKDVKSGAWYTPAVKWAAENGIVNGISATEFAPDTKITREQMCTMLIRYIENHLGMSLEEKNPKKNFADDAEISSWAKESVYKCQMGGLVSGVSETEFSPTDSANRASVATIITRFHEQYLQK